MSVCATIRIGGIALSRSAVARWRRASPHRFAVYRAAPVGAAVTLAGQGFGPVRVWCPDRATNRGARVVRHTDPVLDADDGASGFVHVRTLMACDRRSAVHSRAPLPAGRSLRMASMEETGLRAPRFGRDRRRIFVRRNGFETLCTYELRDTSRMFYGAAFTSLSASPICACKAGICFARRSRLAHYRCADLQPAGRPWPPPSRCLIHGFGREAGPDRRAGGLLLALSEHAPCWEPMRCASCFTNCRGNSRAGTFTRTVARTNASSASRWTRCSARPMCRAGFHYPARTNTSSS